ncbi:MAG: DUF1573 domain-containing protein [Sphingobacteriales bacterium]|uniref:DUF1573 domain-containing protein n=1 Tax=Hydrotalea flava TaxID=714549 RepID=UPI000836B886|nr:DUF1573 domain-containing protein [Hydrotalea flava]RTL48545.1 MAG: DUF1573 domain-containing protein [Sphingobacteriales bacterium]
MKNSILFIILIVSIAFTGHTQITNADISKQFSFSNDNFDFGKIPFGKPAEYTLTITNIGKDTATLDDVRPSCGCTTPQFERGRKFAPGQSVTVVLGFNGNTLGAFYKTAGIFFNNYKLSKQVNFKGETFQEKQPADSAKNKRTGTVFQQ